jgi:lysophospholipase
LTTSGGGYRSLLSGAGVIQGLDGRDSNVSTSGLFQGLTYQAGLSGGSWLLSSFSGNNYPTISYLKENLWKQAFQDSLFDPDYLLAAVAYADIITDIAEKDLAGFHTTLTDPWGRLLSYQLLGGSDGGAAVTLSSVAELSNFTSHAVPYPIITSQGVKTWLGECVPGPNSTVWEFSPYEFGSWASDVSAFTQTRYLGTEMQNGAPIGNCTSNYDNLGYVLGTSSNLFNEVCISAPEGNGSSNITDDLVKILDVIHQVGTEDQYATYRNPFFEYNSSTGTTNSANNVSAQENLSLADGGEAGQNVPLFPLLQPARNISAIIVNDNSADTNNYPNGSSLLTTYVQSLNSGLKRMPFIPSVETFLSKGLNKRATFFGCAEPSKITIVYLPNANFTFASNVSTFQLQYEKSETDAMIANGVEVASQGGKEGWGTCLGCALMMKTGQILPDDCQDCFNEYCYYNS